MFLLLQCDAGGDYDNKGGAVSVTKGCFIVIVIVICYCYCDAAGDYDNKRGAVSVTKGC